MANTCHRLDLRLKKKITLREFNVIQHLIIFSTPLIISIEKENTL